MRVVVLGHSGMLGSAVCAILRAKRHEVVVIPERYDGTAAFVDFISAAAPEAVINCIGLSSGTCANLIRTNSKLLQYLSASLPSDCLLVHASTDAVFSGISGPRAVSERTDALDPYGLSKRLGECYALEHPCTVVLRTSIIGLEPDRTPRSLLSWFLGATGRVNGYTNHLWNGITTIAWAELCVAALNGELRPGVHQPGTAGISKCELLQAIASVWHLSTVVTPVASLHPIDRRLMPTIDLGTIEKQLRQLHQQRGSV
jgi:dTDP-4-dehydrorhamnose reductase